MPRAWFSVLQSGGLGVVASLVAFFVIRQRHYGLRDSWLVLLLCLLVTLLGVERLILVHRRAAKVEQLVKERTEQLKNMALRLSAQFAVSKILVEEQTLHDATPKIIRQLCETLGWEVGAVWSLDRVANVLRCEQFWSSSAGKTAGFEAMTRKAVFPSGLGLPGRVWTNGKAVWIPDVVKDGNFPRAKEAHRAGLHAAFAFPIRLGDEMPGVVEFFNDEIQEPDRRLLEMMEAIGNQMGQFVERKRLEKLKDEFVSTVSHEMRTPLSITKEGISLVLDRIPGEINEEQEKILHTARGNIDRLARIINELLDISKLEAGRMHLKRVKIGLPGLVRQITDVFAPRASAKGLRLQADLPEAGLEVYADPDKVLQVLTNLMDNALKFTEKGSVTLSACRVGEEVECCVSDTGIGISREDLPKIFSKFEQFGRVSGAGDQGTGLGLAIAKQLVELHHGVLRVESQRNQGTRFIFTLPAHLTENVLRELVRDKLHEAAAKGTQFSVLRLSFAASGGSPDELESLLRKRACRPEDELLVMPGEMALLLSECDRESAGRVRSRCERLLRAALARGGGTASSIACGQVTFPDEARTAEELLSKVEFRRRQQEGTVAKVIPLGSNSKEMAG